VDTLGLIWGLAVLPADVQDRDGAKFLLAARIPALPRLAVIWVDGAYTALVEWAQRRFGWMVSTILRPVGVRGYVHLPKRWIVERTFAWLGRYRRLSKDYEQNPASSEAWIYIAMSHRMLRQLKPTRDKDNRLHIRHPIKKRR
jgi:putative transposase